MIPKGAEGTENSVYTYFQYLGTCKNMRMKPLQWRKFECFQDFVSALHEEIRRVSFGLKPLQWRKFECFQDFVSVLHKEIRRVSFGLKPLQWRKFECFQDFASAFARRNPPGIIWIEATIVAKIRMFSGFRECFCTKKSAGYHLD